MKAGAVARVLILWMLAPAATLAIGWYVVLPRLDLTSGQKEVDTEKEPVPRLVKPPKVTVGVKKTEAITVRRPSSYSGTRRRKKEPVKAAATQPVVIKEAPPAPPVMSPPPDAPPASGGGGGGETTPVGNGGL